MKVGIMQPYLFPYLGYFQLIHAVDVFVIYDDVQFIKNGWINRNRIQINNKEILFTFGIKNDSSKKMINQRFYSDKSFESTQKKFLNTVELSYKKAPFFKEIDELLQKIFSFSSKNVAEFNTNCLKILCNYMGIESKISLSSQLEKDMTLKSQARVIAINKLFGSDCYINPIGGSELYLMNAFEENGIILQFIRMKDVKYPQFNGNFIPSLSIIDVLMFNTHDQIQELLNEYELI